MLWWILWIIVNFIPGSILVDTVFDDDVIFNPHRSRLGIVTLILVTMGTFLFCNVRYKVIYTCFYTAVPLSVLIVHALLHVLRLWQYRDTDDE